MGSMGRTGGVASATLALLLAASFAFVGWHKSVDNLADLARYGSWTAHIPVLPGRMAGWSEIGCAILLVLGLSQRFARARRTGALVLIANQCVAAVVHAAHGETGALPQNAVLIVLLVVVAVRVPGAPPDVHESPQR